MGSLLTCVLIEFFRARDKSKTLFAKLVRDNALLFISTVVLFEILVGLNASNRESCWELLRKVVCLPFDERTAEIAADLSRTLRKNRIQVESSNLFIVATALAHDLKLATLNRKHFENIDGLRLIDSDKSHADP